MYCVDNTLWRLEDNQTLSVQPTLVMPLSSSMSQESSIIIATPNPSPSQSSVSSLRTETVELTSSHSLMDLPVSPSSAEINTSGTRASSSSTNTASTYNATKTVVVTRDFTTLSASIASVYSTSSTVVSSGYGSTISTGPAPSYGASSTTVAPGDSGLLTSVATDYTMISSTAYTQPISKTDSEITPSLISTTHTLKSTEFPQSTASVTLSTSFPAQSSRIISTPLLFSSNPSLKKSTANFGLVSKSSSGSFSSHRPIPVLVTITVTVTHTPGGTLKHCNCSSTDVCATEFRRLPKAVVLVIGLVPSVIAIALFMILIFVVCLNSRRNSKVRRKHVRHLQSTPGNIPRRKHHVRPQDVLFNATPGTLASIHLRPTSPISDSFDPDISSILPDPPSTFVHEDNPSCRLGSAFQFVTSNSNVQDNSSSTFSYLTPGDICSQNPVFGLESITELEEAGGSERAATQGGVAKMIAKLEQSRGKITRGDN